jgi:hypothetical protein
MGFDTDNRSCAVQASPTDDYRLWSSKLISPGEEWGGPRERRTVDCTHRRSRPRVAARHNGGPRCHRRSPRARTRSPGSPRVPPAHPVCARRGGRLEKPPHCAGAPGVLTGRTLVFSTVVQTSQALAGHRWACPPKQAPAFRRGVYDPSPEPGAPPLLSSVGSVYDEMMTKPSRGVRTTRGHTG